MLFAAESIEALQAQRNREEDQAKLDARFDNRDFFKNQQAEVNNSLYGWAFVAPEERDTNTTTEAPEELYDSETPSGQTRTRMAERFDKNEWWNAEILEEQLSTPEWRAQNKKRATELFFSPENLHKQYALYGNSTPDINTKHNEDWFHTNTWPEGPLNESFERVMETFVIPSRIDGENLSEIFKNNPKDALIVNDALADAFLLEIYDHTLAWRVNYPEVQVEALIDDIRDVQTTPYEKLRAFGEIHTLVETSVGRGGHLQKKRFQESQAKKAQTAEAQTRAFHAQHEQLTAQAQERQQKGASQEESIPKNEVVEWWDIFAGGDFDTLLDTVYNTPKEVT